VVSNVRAVAQLSKIFENAQSICVLQLVVDESKSSNELKPFAKIENSPTAARDGVKAHIKIS